MSRTRPEKLPSGKAGAAASVVFRLLGFLRAVLGWGWRHKFLSGAAVAFVCFAFFDVESPGFVRELAICALIWMLLGFAGAIFGAAGDSGGSSTSPGQVYIDGRYYSAHSTAARAAEARSNRPPMH
jgi:hypothetical protein